MQVLRRGSELVDLTPEIRRFYFSPAPLIITKSNVVSRVHRRVHMDYIGIKTYRGDGTLDGEVRIVGLFTSQAYTGSPRDIPFLRHKVETVLKMAGYPAASHAGKALMNVLETFPRDELFQIDVDELKEWSEGILDLETRPRVRVFARVDRFDRFVSVLVYVPRDRYSSERARAHRRVPRPTAYKGRVAAFYPYFTDGPLVRVQFIVGRYEGETPRVAIAELERGIAEILRTWDDRLADRARRPRARKADACSPSTAAPSRTATRKPSPSRARWKTSPASSGSGRTCPSPSTSTGRQARRPSASALPSIASASRSASPSACRCWRTWASRHRRALLSDQPASRRRRAARHHARHAARDGRRLADRSRACTTSAWRPVSSPCSGAMPTTTTSIA